MGFYVNVQEHANEQEFARIGITRGARLAYLARFPDAIAWIANPTALEQMVALGLVTQTGIYENRPNYTARQRIVDAIGKLDEQVAENIARYTIVRIPNLGDYKEAIQIIAVKRSFKRYNDIASPSEKLHLELARYPHYPIESLKNPSPKVLMRAIITDPSNIQLVDKPTHEMMKKAVSKDGDSLKHIANPPRDIIEIAIRRKGQAIAWVKNPDIELMRLAVSRAVAAIEKISSPPEEIQMMAMDKSANAIRMIAEPSEDVCWRALAKDKKAIKHIKKPTPEMISYVALMS